MPPSRLSLFLALALLFAPPAAPAGDGEFGLARAVELERRGDWSGLLDWGQQWTRAEPGNAQAWFVLGRAWGKLKRPAEAIAAYRRNLALAPGDVEAMNNLGNAYRDSGRVREALVVYRDAVQLDPSYVAAWHNLGLVFLTLKGAAGVTQALRRLEAVDPAQAEAWRSLALEYALFRDERVARKAVQVLGGLSVDQRRRMFELLFADN